MEPIFPLEEGNLNRFLGRLVCVVMNDGTRHVGWLSGVRKGKIRLNDDTVSGNGLSGGEAGVNHAGHKKKRPRRRQYPAIERESLQMAAPPFPVPPSSGLPAFGPPVALDLTLVAMVFLMQV